MPNAIRDRRVLWDGNNSYVILPQGMLSVPGFELEGFDTLAQWAANGGSGTFAADTVNYRTGSAALKNTPTAGLSYTLRKTVSWSFGTAPERLRFFVYLQQDASYYSGITLYISSVSNISKSFNRTIQASSGFHIGWNVIDVYAGDWTNTGSESWSNTMIRLQFRVTMNSGKSAYASADSLVSSISGFPAVMISFDDDDATIYTEAFQYCRGLKVRCTNYCISDQIGSGLSAGQLQEMFAAGWAIGNHTKTHTDLTTLSQADVQTELLGCKTVLDGLGFSKTSKYVAYPTGAWNETVLAAMVASGMLTGRTVVPNAFPMAVADNLYVIGSQSISNTTTLATAKGYLDAAKANKRVINLLFHRLVASPSTANEYTPSDFRAIIDYGRYIGIPFITIDDFYQTVSKSVRVPK